MDMQLCDFCGKVPIRGLLKDCERCPDRIDCLVDKRCQSFCSQDCMNAQSLNWDDLRQGSPWFEIREEDYGWAPL